MQVQNINGHAHWDPDTQTWQGLKIGATGQHVPRGEVATIDDLDLFVGLCAQPANWVPADAESHAFLSSFCDWVEAVQEAAAAPPRPLPTPPPIVLAFEPPASAPNPAPVDEPPAPKTKRGAAADKAGE